MENNENFVEQTENVETTTEETPVKTFTQEEVNELIGKAKARTRAKIEKENQRKYGDLEEVLKAGMGKEDIGEITTDLRKFYGEKKGIKMPEKPKYSSKEIEVLARAEADEFISAGYEDVVEECDRLASIGVENMSARDKALFHTLATYRQNAERVKELADIGVPESVYNSNEFQTLAKKFNSDTSMADIYDIYKAKYPTEKPKTMGSMKSNSTGDSVVKDYYSPEEAKKFSNKDYDKTPGLYEAVVKSMAKWRK